MIPRKIHLNKPAIVMELKWDKNAEGAIQQMKDKEYIDALKDENQEEISNFFLIQTVDKAPLLWGFAIVRTAFLI